MKAKKSMKKSMRRRKAMKVYKYKTRAGRNRAALAGRIKSTATLKKNKNGRIVSAKMSNRAKKNYANGIGKWTAAVNKARKALNIKGFQAVGGKTAKGKQLLAKARSIY